MTPTSKFPSYVLMFSVAICLQMTIGILFVKSAQAQVPQLFNYQGIARDATGNPLSNQKLALKLAVLPTSDATVAEYEETQLVQTNEFGLYTLQIGNGTTVSGSMKTVKWETGNKYIKVAIDPNGGTDFIEVGTNQLLSVPYAIYADKSGTSAQTEHGKSRTGAVSTSAAGTGTLNFLTKFTAANTIYNSQIFDNGINIGIGTASPLSKLHLQTTTGNVEHIRMQNTNATGFGKFLMHNDNASNYATFTKYGSAVPGGVTGITSQYPFANMLAFGNNGGPLLVSNSGSVGIGIVSGGVTVMKFNANQASGYLGLGGNAVPAAKVHFNTATANDTIKFTNSTTGHTTADGLEIRTVGNTANIINRENSSLNLGTNNSTKVSITANGYVGIGIANPTEDALHIKRSYASIKLEDSNDNAALYIVAPDPTSQTTGGIGTSTNHELPFFTNNVERLVMKADGKIGVNTNLPTTTLDVNGSLRIRGGSPFPGFVLTSDALGNASWQLPGGIPAISPGTAKGNTPYWNDTIWVHNSNNLFNDGSKVGIGTNAPSQLLSVKNRMMVDSNGYVKIGAGAMVPNTSLSINNKTMVDTNGSVKIGSGAILPNTPLSVRNKMMVDTNGTIKMVLNPGKAIIDISGSNPSGTYPFLKGANSGQQGLYYSNDGFLGKSEFMFQDSLGFPYLYISDGGSSDPEGSIFLTGNIYADSIFGSHVHSTHAKFNYLDADTTWIDRRIFGWGTTYLNNLFDTTNVPTLEVLGMSTLSAPKTNGLIRVSTVFTDAMDVIGIVSNITPDTTQAKGIGTLSEGNKVGLIANAFNSGTSALTHAIEANASNNGTCTGLFVKAKNRGTVTGTKNAIIAQATGGTVNNAGLFTGDLMVTGNMSKGGGTFKIDHPQDPENKYLIHSFVESPDMMNVYNGNAVSDANGNAVISLPSYFESENKDFKYQLTVVDNSADFVLAKVSKKISNNSFEIRTSKPNVEVSWQVTGVRKDKWADAHRVIAEVEKEPKYKGSYWHPELYGKPSEEGILIQMGNEDQASDKK